MLSCIVLVPSFKLADIHEDTELFLAELISLILFPKLQCSWRNKDKFKKIKMTVSFIFLDGFVESFETLLLIITVFL